MRNYFRPMLETGTETLWESFDPAASLCHAFSASAVYQLSANVLGVSPSSPGFSRMRIAPQCADLDSAEGSYPTPRGHARVVWQRLGNKVSLTVDIPATCEAEVLCPGASDTVVVGPGSHEFIDGVMRA
jgi:hypothetical protein